MPQLNKKGPTGGPTAIRKRTSVSMPARPLVAFPDETELRTLTMLRMGRSMYMLAEDVPWALDYMRQEIAVGGIQVDPTLKTRKKLDCNCAVPGVHIRWDFQHNAWEAIRLDEGSTIRCAIDGLTETKWERVQRAFPQMTCSLQDASDDEKRNACWKLLELHCSTLQAAAPAGAVVSACNLAP